MAGIGTKRVKYHRDAATVTVDLTHRNRWGEVIAQVEVEAPYPGRPEPYVESTNVSLFTERTPYRMTTDRWGYKVQRGGRITSVRAVSVRQPYEGTGRTLMQAATDWADHRAQEVLKVLEQKASRA